ncbi:hypothetical protein T01_8233 [Trichinella spiralis]|uniref:Uncharacterized protein n=1 Tax=Trichinella spiralis TaxID=6334 RepID=A0A0V1AM21_TRISP|nr:hypothetical protein T01_8233 [Trichinella spiralis]
MSIWLQWNMFIDSIDYALQGETMGMHKVRIVSLSPKAVSEQDGIVEVPEETDFSGITSLNKTVPFKILSLERGNLLGNGIGRRKEGKGRHGHKVRTQKRGVRGEEKRGVRGEEKRGVRGEEKRGVRGEEKRGVRGEEKRGVRGEEKRGVRGEEKRGVRGEEKRGVRGEEKRGVRGEIRGNQVSGYKRTP